MVRLKGNAWIQAAVLEKLIQNGKIDVTITDGEVSVTFADVVMKVQVFQVRAESFEPFEHRHFREEVPVAYVEAVSEQRMVKGCE